jgi:Cu/Ag efflux pump CusA
MNFNECSFLKNFLRRNASGEMMPLGELASVGIAPGRGTIFHDGARRGQVVISNVQNRNIVSFVAEAERKVRSQILLLPVCIWSSAEQRKLVLSRSVRSCSTP